MSTSPYFYSVSDGTSADTSELNNNSPSTNSSSVSRASLASEHESPDCNYTVYISIGKRLRVDQDDGSVSHDHNCTLPLTQEDQKRYLDMYQEELALQNGRPPSAQN